MATAATTGYEAAKSVEVSTEGSIHVIWQDTKETSQQVDSPSNTTVAELLQSEDWVSSNKQGNADWSEQHYIDQIYQICGNRHD